MRERDRDYGIPSKDESTEKRQTMKSPHFPPKCRRIMWPIKRRRPVIVAGREAGLK